jgi:hypothetical protein
MLETAARRDGFRKAENDRRVAYQRGEINRSDYRNDALTVRLVTTM